MKFVLLLILLSVAGCQKNSPPTDDGPPIRVRSSVGMPSINVGDLLDYTIQVEVASNVSFNVPEFTESLGGFAIRDLKISTLTTNEVGRKEQSYTYSLETYLLGNYELPPVDVIYDSGTGTNSILSTPLVVEVVSVADKGDLFKGVKEIKPPLEWLEIITKEKSFWIYIVAAVAVLAIFVLFLIFRRKKDQPKVIPAKPPHIIAFSDLKHLEDLHLIEKSLFKEYYFQLSIILRHYIENQFRLKAPEQTTEEFLLILKDTILFTKDQRIILKKFLQECDLIKFANYQSSAQDAHNANDIVVSFVKETYNQLKREAL